jgi:hypothetical protein
MSRLGNGGHRRGAPLVVLALVGVVLAAGCGARKPTTSEAAAAETAETVCATLRRWNNDLTEVFNATSQQITDDDDPDTAGDVLVDGFDEMIELASDHRDEVDGLDLPAAGWRDDLIAELAAGADESIAVLQDERGEAADLPPIEVDDQGGAVGGASVGLERATAVLEPSVGAYDPVLGAAFAADEGCEHVVQPF